MKIRSLLKRLLLGAAGIIAVETVGNVFDWAVYPFVTFMFGKKLWVSFLLLFFLALILNYILVLAYDFFKKDFFGFEEIKKIKEQAHNVNTKKTWLQKKIIWFEKYGNIPLYLFLSFYDPFMAVLYKRKSTEFKGFTKNDYWLLFFSTLFSCVVWSILWSPVGLLNKS